MKYTLLTLLVCLSMLQTPALTNTTNTSDTQTVSHYPSSKATRDFVQRLLQQYPKARLLDIYKSCFQDYMGAEHLVTDRQRVKHYLDEELSTTNLDDLQPWYYEPCGTDSCYYRVSLRAVMEGHITVAQLLDAFIRSANGVVEEGEAERERRFAQHSREEVSRPSVEAWSQRWQTMREVIDTMHLTLPQYEEDRRFIDSVLAAGRYAISHSPDYREAYHPHYRIVRRDIFEREIKPLFAQ